MCPAGTVFAFGEKWCFGNLLILHDFIGPLKGGAWGFFAVDPMWVEASGTGDASDALDEMLLKGSSHPAETASTKYMSYDGDAMELFIVLESSDWEAMRSLVEPAFQGEGADAAQ